jgi:phosphatidylserine decarboxylase
VISIGFIGIPVVDADWLPHADDMRMKFRPLRDRLLQNEALNFALTNRIPRAGLTRFMGWFSKLEQPVVREVSIAAWRLFADLDLSDARKSSFRSLHDCFIRELKPGARPVDRRRAVLSSPCDAIVGACGEIQRSTVLQAKGKPYRLEELLGRRAAVEGLERGCYVTLRLTSAMYHRFHAPHDCRVHRVTWFPGDVWNVNPPTLRRIDRVFCRNERASLELRLLYGDHRLVMVPVAAVLVASLRLNFIDVLLDAAYRGPRELACDADFAKGEEMGWFQHGSTIIVLAPHGFRLADGVQEGERVLMGGPLLHLPAAPGPS